MYRMKLARASLVLWLAAVPALRTLRAQRAAPVDVGGAIRAGGEEERYLRVLQIAGLAPLVPWSIQPFSPSQTRDLRDAQPNPWGSRLARDTTAGAHLLRPQAELAENSSFPYEIGNGPTWFGRGLTGQLEAGAYAGWGMLHAQIAPIAFLAQNVAFPLAANGTHGKALFEDPRFPFNIDAPQRFGTASYGRLDPGESSLTFDGAGLFLGASTAANQWGPARDFALVLGPNAGGFPSVFAGTSSPVDLWLFRLHARVVYGQLAQSGFTTLVANENKRLGSGLVLDVLPRGIPGLELGATRFIHDPWPAGGLTVADFKRPFANGANLSSNAVNSAFENQVASVFARWALPAARSEFYGEFYKEDYPGHFHESISLVESPDDLAAFTVGFQHVLSASPARVHVLRAEVVNGETSPQQRTERGFVDPIPPYTHADVTQGHTVNGLILGSPDAYGGSGWRIGVDDYTASGRRSTTFERSLRLDWLPTLGNSPHPDVIYAVRQEWVRFGKKADYGFTIVPAFDFNRNLGHDTANLAAAITVTGW